MQRWTRKRALTVLKYLVTHASTEVHRERLVECLWTDADGDTARRRLKVVVYFLRHQFRNAGVVDGIVEMTASGYMLRRAAVWIDSLHFQQLARDGAALHLSRAAAPETLPRGLPPNLDAVHGMLRAARRGPGAMQRLPGLFATGNYFAGPSVATCVTLSCETAGRVDRFLRGIATDVAARNPARPATADVDAERVPVVA